MQEYKIVKYNYRGVYKTQFGIKRKSIFGFWYNPLNIDAYQTGYYDTLEEAELEVLRITNKVIITDI